MNVGCHPLDVLDPVQNVPIPTHVLYPTRDAALPVRFDPFVLDVAMSGAPAGDRLPLVVLSHGTGSSPWLFRGLAAHLAREGFAIVLLRHPGNNRGDDGLAFTIANLENRPRHLHLAIDAAFDDALLRAHLDPRGVAVIGHSLGGYTALALAGGRPTAGPNETKDGKPRVLSVVRDPRVRALVLLAPATGWFLFDGALTEVTVPIFVRSGSRDEYAPRIHGEVVAGGVADRSRVDFEVVPNAGHFSFMTPYPPELKRPEVPPSQDPSDFDRASYEHVLKGEVARFLRATLLG